MTLNKEPRPTRFAELVLDRPTFAEVARRAGVDPSFVSKVAAGTRKPSARVRAAAEAVLGLSATEIFPETDSE